ncbi:TIGR01620 family protein [Chelatococcus sp. SYSU_G07232]|uniref:TIGR01620 family protein n=1 Tax=Chelatococcus albus TaxID=3047466 RepID=A0ABT7AIQ1_9HYPH|nr:TIGR01620 family protein [Chelatococcus sp. SYSU_G07232]MDJ1158471.1 TIGR01620 family protein [Chelatococcus sp. SYSU_G07232]
MSKAPRAFRLDDPDVVSLPQGETPAVTSGGVVVVPDEEPAAEVAGVAPRRRRMPWLGLLLSALGGLLLMGLGLALERMIAELFASHPAFGWLALGLAALAGLAFLGLLGREAAGVLRERRIEALRRRAAEARERKDDAAAEAVVRDLAALYARRPETASARAAIAALGDAIIDAPDRLAIAERELMTAMDREARRIVAEAARQVSLVTAVSPRAIVDVAFVLYASARLVRRIAALYGGRPGFLGFLRLSGHVLTHLTLTGSIAVGDGLLQQVMGLGLAARVSARLGEGVLNGLLTARVGLSAIAVCRPMPFAALEAPALVDVAASLFDRKAGEPAGAEAPGEAR